MERDTIDVRPASVPGQQGYGGLPFPMVLECRSATDLEGAERWVAERRAELLDQSTAHGAILFRGFPLATAEDFDRFIAAFGLANFPYEKSLSNAVRVVRTPRVFTANEAPPTVPIFLHHEMAQTPIYPGRLFFFCEKAAEAGGATPICRSDVLWSLLEEKAPAFARDCESKGLRYSNVMPPETDLASGMGRTWQGTLGVADREGAEARLRELNYTWEWLEDGSLRATTPVLPAVHALPDGRRTFFNQLIAASMGWKDSRNDPSRAITHGDGSPLDRDGVLLAAELAESLTFDVPWRTGDVALVDNFVTMHGRRTFSGSRKVLASLAAVA